MADAWKNPGEDDQKDMEDFLSFVKGNVLTDISAYLTQKMALWRNMVYMEQYLNIGVLGSPGVGKSTFINTLRMLKPTDPGAAPTGVVQTTMEPTWYEHPQNPRVRIWDLPGCGSPNFSREKYLETVHRLRFDFFIIVCSSRFTEHDLWFAQEMRNLKKRFYFVRTKTDIDVRNYRQDYPHIRAAEVLQKVRSDCISNLSDAKFKNADVFLVCKNPLTFEFAALEETIIDHLPERTRLAALMSLRGTSVKVIHEKAALLQKSSWLTAATSAAISASADTQMSIKMDAHILCGEIMFYKKVFGLDDEGLKQFSKLVNVPEHIVFDAVKENFWTNLSVDRLLTVINDWATRRAANDGTKSSQNIAEGYAKSSKSISTPIEDFIISRLSSFTAIKEFLQYLIGSMEKAMLDAINVAFAHSCVPFE